MWTSENRGRYDRSKLRYPSDLTDEEWRLVEPLIPPAKRGGGKRTVSMREVVNGLMYVLSTGCQWRAIPKDLPARSTVHGYLDLWDYDGTLKRLHHALYIQCRERAGREASPTAAIIDSQSCQATRQTGFSRTFGAAASGRRMIAGGGCPRLGRLLRVSVTRRLLPLIPAGLIVDQVNADLDRIVISTRSRCLSAACPICGHVSDRVHSRYTRVLGDLPWQGRTVIIHVAARRLRCAARPGCRTIFAERLPGIAKPHGRRTDRLADLQRHLGLALGGEGGSRLAARITDPFLPYLRQRLAEGMRNATQLWREISAFGYGRDLLRRSSMSKNPAWPRIAQPPT